ncbi:MAG TPA: tripartite tricarboxylate transporter substrate binding protein [Xanthobacteraceae bacterium]|nr:tripartite tricarboxylate transporter substrate binding protein [Xanthobacteraceae bacterium]
MSAAAAWTFALVVCAGGAFAAWPEHPVTIIVPFPTGGATDLLGRILATHLAPMIGQTVVVKNVVGEVGTAGLREAAAAAPNGYTLLVTTNAALINIQINKSLPRTAYDTPKDFAPIAYLGSAPNVVVTGASSGIDSVAGLIAWAKANPGKLTCASPGIGSSSEVALELLKERAGIDVMQMEFDGSEPAFMAATSGATTIAAVGIGGLIDRLRVHNIKVLVQTGKERWPDLPDVPTMAEAGITDAVVETSQMFAAPAGTPPPVINTLTNATRQILQRAEIKAELQKAGFAAEYEGPDELHERVLREIPLWREIVERVGLTKRQNSSR